MAQVNDVKGTKGYCDRVYGELIAAKERLISVRGLSGSEGTEKPIVGAFERHLDELIETIDWKIQILAHSCPYDWKGSESFENDVQVDEADKASDSEKFSPGYLGG